MKGRQRVAARGPRLVLTLLTAAILTACAAPSASPAPSPTAAPVAVVPTSPPPTLPPPAAVPTLPPPTAVPTPPPPTATPRLPTATPLPVVPTPTSLPVRRMLDVPIHRQQHALSCEAAALRMAMGALGKHVAEDDLLADLARDPTPRRVLADGSLRWGDPDFGFVGHWDGVYLKDGYGVYDGPIAALAKRHGFAGTTHASGADPRRLYGAVRQGFPVVAWVPYGLTVKDRGAWTTPEGKRVDYVVTEHAVVLAGVDGEGVYYADPLAPRLLYATYDIFERAFAEIDNRAVVLRP